MQTKPLAVKENRVVIDTALSGLSAGEYVVQLNVVDAQHAAFAFARAPMVVAR
jgi:hypothetical protein